MAADGTTKENLGAKEEKPKEIGKEREKERKERRKEEKEKEKKEKEKGPKADASIAEAHITLEIALKRAKEKVSSTLLTGWSERNHGRIGHNQGRMKVKQFANYLDSQLFLERDLKIVPKFPTSQNPLHIR